MNYAALTAAIQEYLQTTETGFVSNIPLFVRQAEERLAREVMIPAYRVTASGSITIGQNTIPKPANYLSTFSLSVGAGGVSSFLMLKDQEFLQEAFPDAAARGTPVFYAHRDATTWVVAPPADGTYSWVVTFYRDAESIVTAGTTWLGDNAESALLYACLVEAYTFLKGDPDLIELYQKRYDAALRNLLDLGMVRTSRDDYREGEIRVPVR